LQLRLGQLCEVLVPQHLHGAPAGRAVLGVGSLGLALPRALLEEPQRLWTRPRLRLDRRAQEPGTKGAVEGVEILVPRDEGLAQRPVDVVLALELDEVETSQRVGD